MTHHHRRIGNATCFQAASPPAPPPPQGPGIRHISQGPGRAAPKTPGGEWSGEWSWKINTAFEECEYIFLDVFEATELTS